jgi:periplasmic copper chaperone A
MSWRAAIVFALVSGAFAAPDAAAQRTVRASDAWISASDSRTVTAFVLVENGTMYDVYLTGVETEVAGAVELLQATEGKTAVVKEVAIPAFDRLEMSPGSTYLRFRELKKPLKAGETHTLILQTDTGERLEVAAVVK